jgi:hypothetical protein
MCYQMELLLQINIFVILFKLLCCFTAGILQLSLMVQELAWPKSEHNKGSTGILFLGVSLSMENLRPGYLYHFQAK